MKNYASRPSDALEVGSRVDDNEEGLRVYEWPRWIAPIVAGTCLIAGTGASFAFKWMNKIEVAPCDGCDPIPFEGALIQTFMMFVGESMCWIVWIIDGLISGRKGYYRVFDFVDEQAIKDNKPHGKFWWWLLPASMDFVSTLLINTAIKYTYNSTVSLLRNFMVVVTAVCQVLILRRALRVHEIAGVAIVTCAMILAAIPAALNPEGNFTTGQTILGCILAVLGTSLQALQIVVEEFFFRKGQYSPVKAVGMEGLWGLLIFLPASFISHFSGYEDVVAGFYQIRNSGALMGIMFGYFIVCFLFNGSALATTKLISGLMRAVIYAVRAPLIWILDLSLRWIDFDFYNLGAFLIFFIGFFCYSRIYPRSRAPAVLDRPVHCGQYTRPEYDEKPPGTEVWREGLATSERYSTSEP